MALATKRKGRAIAKLRRRLGILCLSCIILPTANAGQRVAVERRGEVLEIGKNQSSAFDEIGARWLLERMSRYASTLAEDNATKSPPSKEDLDCIPDRCANGPIISDGEIISLLFPDLYLDYLGRMDDDGKEYFLSLYRGPWNPEIDTEVLSLVARKECSQSLFHFLVVHSSPEGTRLLLTKTRSRWARERWAAIEALVQLNPKLGWGLYTRALTADPSLNLCERSWASLIELNDPRLESWFDDFLSRRTPDRIRFAASAFKGQANDPIEGKLAGYAIRLDHGLRYEFLKNLCFSSQPEVDTLFAKVGPHSPIELRKLWCRYVWSRQNFAALPRLRFYAKSQDRELSSIARNAIEDMLNAKAVSNSTSPP